MLYVTEGTNTYKRRQADTELSKQALGLTARKKAQNQTYLQRSELLALT